MDNIKINQQWSSETVTFVSKIWRFNKKSSDNATHAQNSALQGIAAFIIALSIKETPTMDAFAHNCRKIRTQMKTDIIKPIFCILIWNHSFLVFYIYTYKLIKKLYNVSRYCGSVSFNFLNLPQNKQRVISYNILSKKRKLPNMKEKQ